LPGGQESDRVNVAAGELPGNAVAGMDPHLVGEKGHRLPGHVCTLPTDGSLPILLSLNGVGETQKGHQQRCEEDVTLESLADLHWNLQNSYCILPSPAGSVQKRCPAQPVCAPPTRAVIATRCLQAFGPNNSASLLISLIFAVLASN
jgi:hypothetical protein